MEVERLLCYERTDEDGVAFELYWANFSVHDIQRESVGHLKDPDGKVVRLDKNKKK